MAGLSRFCKPIINRYKREDLIMEKRNIKMVLVFLMAIFLILPGQTAFAEKPIIIGAPLSTAFLYGWDAERGIKLAVEEINAAGGCQCWW